MTLLLFGKGLRGLHIQTEKMRNKVNEQELGSFQAVFRRPGRCSGIGGFADRV